jgi:DNA-directed RNA polymerase beta subunit
MADTHIITPVVPFLPEGRRIYDDIMAEIEPDLTTEGRLLLAEKYKNESPTQTRLRAKRYDMAHAEYQRRYESTMNAAKSRAMTYRRALMTETEKRVHERDDVPILQRITDAIQTFLKPA